MNNKNSFNRFRVRKCAVNRGIARSLSAVAFYFLVFMSTGHAAGLPVLTTAVTGGTTSGVSTSTSTGSGSVGSTGTTGATGTTGTTGSTGSGTLTSETVAQAVQRALSATGSALISGGITDWSLAGTLTFYGVDGPHKTFPIAVLQKGRTSFQRVVQEGAHQIRQGTDGVNSWDSLDGIAVLQAQGRTAQYLQSQTVRSVQNFLDYQQQGLVLNDQGFSGTTHVVQAQDKQGRTTSYSIDGTTSLVTKLEFVTGSLIGLFGESVPATDSFVFSDYQAVQGVLTPFKIERYNNGIKVEEMEFTSIQYNVGVSATAFKP